VLVGIVAVATGEDEGPALIAATFVGQWIGWIGACVLASRRAGTGSLRDDLGWRFERADLGLGVVVALVGLVAAVVVQGLLSAVSDDYVGSNTGLVEEQAATMAGAITIGLSTMIGAPIVEELFFRGLLQRALHRLAGAAVIVQALIFGLVHVTPGEGLGNVGIVLGLTTFGSVLGLAVQRWGRLGPAIVGHALFNAAAVVPLLLSAG
jgi:uncharacterized protein